MEYLYYPGCSLHAAGKGYDESLLAVFRALGVPLRELDGWNCCGATAYMSVDELKAFALAARNLALAEQECKSRDVCLVAPCSACYLVLTKVQHRLNEYDQIRRPIVEALRNAGLTYHGDIRVRHPLDVLVNDVGVEKVCEGVTAPLEGLKVACYYGCQVVRPYASFDDQYDPTTMDELLRAVGAEVVDWPLKARCCGGTLTGTVEEVGQRLSYILLKEAKERGADAIATCCPLCQFNLECYQTQIARRFGNGIGMPVAYFTQLLGRAMGIGDRELGLHRSFVPLEVSAV